VVAREYLSGCVEARGSREVPLGGYITIYGVFAKLICDGGPDPCEAI